LDSLVVAVVAVVDPSDWIVFLNEGPHWNLDRGMD
jgi:hypothetical protein